MIKLQDFDHFRNNPMVQFKEETVGGVDVVIPHYMIADNEFWKLPLATELRGHVFRKDTGECISMAFEKFFNISEREDTQVHNIDWNRPFSVLEKRDGSMITAVLINDKVYFKTKKSFYSDVAKLANKLAPDNVRILCRTMLYGGISPIFEFTHPDWKVVVDYGQESTWTLLALRVMELSENSYYDYPYLNKIRKIFNINIPKIFNYKSYDEIKNSIDILEGMEGYVIEFDDSRYKTKCNWYNIRHHVNTDLRERDVIRMIHEETIDDVKSIIVEAGHDLDKVIALEERYAFEYSFIVNSIHAMAKLLLLEPNKKSMAEKYGKQKYFNLAVKLIENRNVDYKTAWEKEFFKHYSISTVYTDFNHLKELDEAA